MKKIIKNKTIRYLISFLILTTFIVRPMIIKANSAVTFQEGMLVLTPEGINGANPDFFRESTKNLLPGDNKTFTITLQNNSQKAVKFYFWASDTDFNNDVNKKELSDQLLSLINLRINLSDNNQIYNGPANGKGENYVGASKIFGNGRADGISLGTLGAGSSITMNISIHVPKTLNNDYQNSLAATDWIFLCEVYEGVDPTLPITPTPTITPIITPRPTLPPTTIPTDSPTIIPTATPEITPTLEVTPTQVIPTITPEPTDIDESGDDELEIEDDLVPLGTPDDVPEGVIIIDDTSLGKLPQTGTMANVFGNTANISSVVLILFVVCVVLGFMNYKIKDTSKKQ